MMFKTLYKNLTNKVYNDDIIIYEKNITSLNGRPKKIIGSFKCSNNLLTTLKGRPKEVTGDFHCVLNKLTTLEGRPKMINGDFKCNGNINLKDIKSQIIKYQIKANKYFTDEGNFSFKDIENEFNEYCECLEKNKKIKEIDFGLSI